MNIGLLKQELFELDHVLTSLKYKEWFPVCGGTVYSMIKFNNKLNPGDDDIDLHVKRDHAFQLVKFIQVMEYNGYYIRYKYFNSNNQVAEITLLKHGQKKYGIDINILDKVDNEWLYTCYIGVDTPIEIVKTLPLETYDDVVLDNLEEQSFCRPNNYDLYLKTMYRDWKVGRKNYEYWNPEHAGNIKEVREWKGRAVISEY